MRSKLSSRSESAVRTRGCTQLERHVPAYREYLLGRGNASGYVRSCEAAVMHLSMWMRQGNRRLTDIDEALVVEFLDGHLPQCNCETSARHPACVRAALAHLLVVLREAGATYCIDLHPKMPPLAEQLPMLRALWPGPLVCRWNLNPLHGAYGYEDAQREYSPYDRIHDVDEDTRALIVRTVRGVTGAGQNAYVTISNKAEGCAPLSALALAERLAGPPLSD